MARPEVTGKRLLAVADEADAFSIANFANVTASAPNSFTNPKPICR